MYVKCMLTLADTRDGWEVMQTTIIVRFYSKGNPVQVCFQSCHVPAMQKTLFENRLTDLHFSYKYTFFSSGTLDGPPFE